MRLEVVRLKMGVTNMTMWCKRVRTIKPYPTIPSEVKDYFLEPSDVDWEDAVVVVSCACGLSLVVGLVYGLLLGAIR